MMTTQPKILLIDGEAMLRDVTAMMLSRHGGRVQAAATLDEAMQYVSELVYDVAIVDESAESPRASEVLAQMRALGRMPKRVIVCTSEPSPAAEGGQFSEVIAKPFAFDRLVSAVFGPADRRRRAHSGLFPRIRVTMRRGASPRQPGPGMLPSQAAQHATESPARLRRGFGGGTPPSETTVRTPRRAAQGRRGHG